LAGEDAAGDFVRRLYERISDRDLGARPAGERAGVGLQLLAFARRRLPGVAKVRAFNPTLAEHGVEARGSIVQLVNDDMPFLVDSVLNELARRDIAVHLLAHPVIAVRRDLDGDLASFGSDAGERAASESMMSLEIERQADRASLEELAAALQRMLAEVRLAVADWGPLQAACRDAKTDLARDTDATEHAAFLDWLVARHFTFLGHRQYRYADDPAQPAGLRYDLVPGSALGILRDDRLRLFDPGVGGGEAMVRFARGPRTLAIVKTDRRALVHRDAAMDCVIVKVHDSDGRAVGERRLVGLFTSRAYHAPAADVPVLRAKTDSVLRRSGFDRDGHDGKALEAILEAWPRDELFQIDPETLHDHAIGVLQLQERRRVALFSRLDTVGRFASCLVFCPRERFDEALAERFGAILARAWGGEVAATTSSARPDSPLAQLLFSVRLSAAAPSPDLVALEAALAEAAATWSDRFHDAAQARFGEAEGRTLARERRAAFPATYRETFGAADALADLPPLDEIASGAAVAMRLAREAGTPPARLQLRLFHPGAPRALSDILPALENFGLRVISEAPFALAPAAGGVALQVLTLETADGRALDQDTVGTRFLATLHEIWSGAQESDRLNALVLSAGLDWREVALLRSYARYLRQTGIPFSQDYMDRTIAAWPDVAAGIVALFRAGLDPALGAADAGPRRAAIDAAQAALDTALERVATLDEDRILRRTVDAVRNTLRTDFFQRDAQGQGRPRPWIAHKLDSRALADLPAPRPLVEIFVCAPRVEGIHLRGGRVARGGLRWSDRREDFRTEILGLMKTQMVKNAVIVPVGSKGGFYVKQPPASGGREAQQAEGVACYRLFIRALLGLTDNLAPSGIVPPPDTVRHDGDDPYLVVAADKGTATFSDIANGLAREAGFWLDDAFASGGSAGYDHKKMGITAKGAWEQVKRHFREAGTDIQTTPFTVAGVGDMSGDVFGNGMLLSRQIRLVAAFDHRNIFLDPSPDPALSWAERERLFALPRSSWKDYDASLISAGGGVFERGAKSIALSSAAAQVLGLTAGAITPIDLMRGILKAPVDLLYFGGIGTYVKASSESHAEAGDRATEALRIDAVELHAGVLGEGANLALTQRARIEAALAGRRLNTDALDNSAGVDTSDHEVNIKVATGAAIGRGALAGGARDTLLASMTDEVAALVLRNNYQQGLAITVAEARAAELHDRLERAMRRLERAGKLDRAVEALPASDAMRRRAAQHQPLTRPELSVLLAYAKIDLNEALLASDLPDDPLLEPELLRYFPQALREGFAPDLKAHRLRREITALQVVNSTINRGGPSFVHDVADRTGAPAAGIARAFAVVRDAWRLRDLWTAIESLDHTLKAPAQTAMMVASQRFLERAVQWVLRRWPQPLDTMAATARLGPAVEALQALPAEIVGPAEMAALEARVAGFVELGAPRDLAKRVASLDILAVAGDLLQVAETRDPVGVAGVYFRLGERLGLAALREGARKLPREGGWPALATASIAEELDAAQAALCRSALAAGGDSLAAWERPRAVALARYDRLAAEIAAAGAPDLAMLTVALAELRSLA